MGLDSQEQAVFDSNRLSASGFAACQTSDSQEDADASSESETDHATEENNDNKHWVNDTLINDDPFGWALINDLMLDDGHGLSAEECLGEDFKWCKVWGRPGLRP